MRQNIADYLYSNFLGRTSQKKHPVVGFLDFFSSSFFFFFHFLYWFLNNNEKCALKISASEVVQFSKDSDFFFVFFPANFFLFTFKKIRFVYFFKTWTKNNWQQINWNYHQNPWTILLLVMRRFSNYAKKIIFLLLSEWASDGWMDGWMNEWMN